MLNLRHQWKVGPRLLGQMIQFASKLRQTKSIERGVSHICMAYPYLSVVLYEPQHL
jgi:hypothetical protein